MKQFAADGSQAVAEMKAMKALASNPAGNLEDIAKTFGGEELYAELDAPKDVTYDFLKVNQYYGPEVLATDFFIYRGLVQSLLGRMDVDSKIGIMAGEQKTVVEVCIADDVPSALANPELQKRWTASNLEIMGLVVWSDTADVSKCAEPMATLLSMQQDKPFLQLMCHPNGGTSSWEFNRDGSGEFVSASLNNHRKSRRKDIVFKVFKLEQVGVTIEDSIKSLVSTAIGSYVGEKMQSQQHKKKRDNCQNFVKLSAPPDGFCFWHSVMAGLNLEKYQKVSRHENGFAINQRQEQAESMSAKNLRKTACGDKDPEVLFPNGYVGLFDLQSVGEKLNLAIRVTISEEAGGNIYTRNICRCFYECNTK